jgi:Icc-related predicted phosphoesterase
LRVLAAADIHGALFVYEWLVRLAQSADVLILAGDLFDADFPAEQRKQAEKIITRLQASSVPVLYLMGNDDNVPLDYEDILIQPLHGRRIEIGEFNFVGYQYTPPFVGDMFVKPDNEIEVDLGLLEPLVDVRTVLVTHSPAFGSLDLCYEENAGSHAIADFMLRKPVLAHIHGHIHHRFGSVGNHFNVASAATCRAMLIDLLSLRHEVITYSEV